MSSRSPLSAAGGSFSDAEEDIKRADPPPSMTWVLLKTEKLHQEGATGPAAAPTEIMPCTLIHLADHRFLENMAHKAGRVVQGALLLLHRSCPPGQTEQLYFLCVDCPENTMKPTPGTGKCLRCPEGSRSQKGRAWCECGEGHAPVNPSFDEDQGVFSCVKCPVGTYKNVSGNVACSKCGGASTSPRGSTSSKACVPWVSTIINCAGGDCKNVGVLLDSASETASNAVKGATEAAGGLIQETAIALEDAATTVVDIALESVSYLVDTLDIVNDLFQSKTDFAEEIRKHPPPNQSGGGGNVAGGEPKMTMRIRCESAEAFQGWYRDSVMWREFDASAKAVERRSGGRNSCRRMKDLARKVLLNFHPDKVAAHFPHCPADVTLPAIMELNRRYASLKTSCKANGDL